MDIRAERQMMTIDSLTISFVDTDFEVGQLGHSAWDQFRNISICTYWNAEPAPVSRQFAAQALWSEPYLYMRFETERGDELVVSTEPRTDVKTIGLWERDVCEIFVAPDSKEPRKYFEFEVAPTGEWLDLAIDMTSEERITDWEYHSGIEAAALIQETSVLMAMKIPWEAFGQKPKAGDVWLGNIFRSVGKETNRGYLAWQPTMTETPNFHVPERFGRLIFDN